MQRVPFDEVHRQLTDALIHLGFTAERAALCARLFAETTRDGVYSHGVSRFPRFVAMIRNGNVDPAAEPSTVSRFGAMERWDGRRGPGNLNAHGAMTRAIALSREHGIGCIALGNTNHWMRGGTYGWQAAEAGAIGICWTNTMPNLPPWGAADPAIGNNPLVIAVPRANGPVVLDIAMSQFSYGAIEGYRKRGEALPVDGGFDAEGHLTRDAAAIEATQRLLPIGYWKGSGLAIVLDMIAAMLSLGNATHQIDTDPLRETGLSQVFLAMQPAALGDQPAALDRVADEVVASLHRARPSEPGKPIRYPGENTLRLREENTRLGLPVDPALWQEIVSLAV
jgi:3-dehydro-L-gulonate 2-dehydrogenase